jgi:hypothetical protein
VAQAASSSENTNNGNASAPYSAGITCQAHRHRHVKVDGTDSGATHPGDRDKWGRSCGDAFMLSTTTL